MLDRTGETTPPCGAPESVAFHSQSSRYPAWSICLIVSIRKSCERACRGPTWRFAVATPVLALSARGLSGGRGPCPGAEVFGAGVPGGVPVMGAAGVFPGDDRASDHAFRGIIVLMPISG